jgi:hypothetical protein
MSRLRSFNRFVLIGLALLGLSVSTGASARTFLVEFQANHDTGAHSDPYWPIIINPGDTLFDFTIEQNHPIDTSTALIVSNSEHPIVDLRLYQWGDYGQHGTVSTTIVNQSPIDIFDDSPRDGNVDFASGFMEFFAPDPYVPYGGGGAPLLLHTLEFWNVLPGGVSPDPIRFTNNQSTGYHNFIPGNLVISEVSAVPVPAAVWLFGTALVGFIGISRKTKVA